MAKSQGLQDGRAPREGDASDRVRREIRIGEVRFADYGARLATGGDALGDHLKAIEGREARRAAMPGLPIYVRVDGKAFSAFTRGMERPFDPRMSRAMVETARFLVAQTGAALGYTQSDEISLAYWYPDPKTEPFLGGRFQKLASVLAGMASSKFALLAVEALPEAVLRQPPSFDARAFDVPGLEDLAACMIWRELDATKNAVSMAARAHFPHKALHGKSAAEMQEMLFREKGVNMNALRPSVL